jgi:D-aminopeptidase
MTCFGRKGGIGTSSRLVAEHGCTVGVLVLANFGSAEQLRVDGVPVGRLLGPVPERPNPAGSCIVVVATDAPLSTRQLERVARRAGLGLARTGSVAHHASGEIFLAFATTGRRPREQRGRGSRELLDDRELDLFFAATADATEEAVLNALWSAVDTTGRNGRVARALPHDDVLELLERAQRLDGRGR